MDIFLLDQSHFPAFRYRNIFEHLKVFFKEMFCRWAGNTISPVEAEVTHTLLLKSGVFALISLRARLSARS